MRKPNRFEKDLLSLPSIDKKVLEDISKILLSGQLFRYNKEFSYVNQFEIEIAKHLNVKYALAVNSCGSALHLSLKSLNLNSQDTVLLNSFSLAPVPGAINKLGCQVKLVNVNDDLVIELDDLEKKILKFKPKCLLLSYMRGYYPKIENVLTLCNQYKVRVIEDCAHSFSTNYKGKYLGTWGDIGCFSLQTYKQLNCGEGGIIVTNDEELFSKLIILSGSYMFYKEHSISPPSNYFNNLIYNIPNYSSRINEITGIIGLSELKLVKDKNKKWRYLYFNLKKLLKENSLVKFPDLIDPQGFNPTSILFYLNFSCLDKCILFRKITHEFNLSIKWFGDNTPVGFTSNYNHWQYLDNKDKFNNLDFLFDLRLSLNLTDDDLLTINNIIQYTILKIIKE